MDEKRRLQDFILSLILTIYIAYPYREFIVENWLYLVILSLVIFGWTIGRMSDSSSKTTITTISSKKEIVIPGNSPGHSWASSDYTPFWCSFLTPVVSWNNNTFTVYLAKKSNFLVATETEYGISINCQEPAEWYPLEPKRINCTATGIQFYLGDILHQIAWPQQRQT